MGGERTRYPLIRELQTQRKPNTGKARRSWLVTHCGHPEVGPQGRADEKQQGWFWEQDWVLSFAPPCIRAWLYIRTHTHSPA